MTTETAPSKDIHTSFGLTYANYLVLPRTLLQSMPEEWQRRFVRMVDEMQAAFRHVEQAECYDVIPGIEREVGELTDVERERLGIVVTQTADLDDDEDDRETLYRDREGNEMEGWERVVFPTPDPVPHYNRGRTRIEPTLVAE